VIYRVLLDKDKINQTIFEYIKNREWDE